MKSTSEEDNDKASGISRFIPSIILFSTVSGFFLLAWYAYSVGTQSTKDEDLLVIEADKTPIKEEPKSPSGMQFPNQDKTIFDTFATDKPPARIEHVLPPPEEPIESVNTARITIKDDDRPSETTEKKPAEDKKIVETKIDEFLSEKPTLTPLLKLGNSKIQLGAYGSEKEAKENWQKLQNKFPQLIQYSPIIIRADVKGKIFYRLRVSGFADKDAAKSTCNGLSSKGQACIVVSE